MTETPDTPVEPPEDNGEQPEQRFVGDESLTPDHDESQQPADEQPEQQQGEPGPE